MVQFACTQPMETSLWSCLSFNFEIILNKFDSPAPKGGAPAHLQAQPNKPESAPLVLPCMVQKEQKKKYHKLTKKKKKEKVKQM